MQNDLEHICILPFQNQEGMEMCLQFQSEYFQMPFDMEEDEENFVEDEYFKCMAGVEPLNRR